MLGRAKRIKGGLCSLRGAKELKRKDKGRNKGDKERKSFLRIRFTSQNKLPTCS